MPSEVQDSVYGQLSASLTQTRLGCSLYVTDAVYHERNAERIEALARGADKLFIEAVFTQELAARAQERYHLTAAQAGWLAHQARVKSVVAFHHSPLYHGQEALLQAELEAHFRFGIPPQQTA